MRKDYINECKTIKRNCEYNAEIHHIIAAENKNLSIWLQIVPAIIAALSGLLITGQIIPTWWGWLTVISAVITAVTSILNPLKEYYDHLYAAKNFTVLKHDARALYETFNKSMNENEFGQAAKNLLNRYNDLVRFAPPTNNDAFEKARKRIKEGVHEQDEE